MISFKRVVIKNFRAYQDIAIDFKFDKGVFLMSGDNGSGKSTFLNAINWCLYGDTPFYTVEDVKEVVNSHAPDDAVASVELFADIRARKYRFFRSTRRGSPGGVLTVSVEDNGNWSDLDGIHSQDAVRKVLPKDLRHLFFFNGEQLKDIFSKNSNEHDLKFSVYKVSELNIIDSAIKHLDMVEDLYLKQISKQSKNSEKINALKSKKEDIESRIEGHTSVINELQEKVSDKKQRIAELDKLIKDSAESRYMLEKRDDLKDKIKALKDDIDVLCLDKADSFHKNFHRLILNDEFEKYSATLVEASRQGIIPPPINPSETAKILKSGICTICHHHISDIERSLIEKQHAEYTRMQELKYLTEGINTFEQVSHELPDIRYNFKDILEKINRKRSEKSKFEEELKKVHENLEGVDESNLHDNPQMSRTHLEDRIAQINQQIGFDARNKDLLLQALKKVNTELNDTTKQETGVLHLDELRLKAQSMKSKLSIIKDVMEQTIRNKLQASVWSTFSTILPHTNFTEIKLDSNYTISLTATDGIIYNTGMLATGPTKVLGLSLAHGLSQDLGYTDVPFLIDNLYGDIKDTHYKEITDMISSLSKNKQIFIMDLNIDKTERGFDSSVISQRFLIERMSDTNKTEIRELSNGY